MHMRTHASVERPRRAMKRYARRWERHWWRLALRELMEESE